MPRKLTRDETSLLLYLETRAVDHGGAVDGARMNENDFAAARRWADEGLIGFGRITMSTIPGRQQSAWVTLSPEAWRLAHSARRKRASSSLETRRWESTAEARGEAAPPFAPPRKDGAE